jgi:radical SAM enzyme (TIGR01210 family)
MDKTIKDKTKPLFHWYVDCLLGKELIFALYTRPCRYGKCAFCGLPSMSLGGDSVGAKDIEKQIDYILSEYSPEQLNQVSKVSIYTASSSLDQECLPTRTLMYLALKISDFPKLKLVSLETRPEYVEDWELKALKNLFGNKAEIEIGIGYETHNPELRNKILHKGLTKEELENLLKQLSENNCLLKAYLMIKPHFSLTEEQGIIEAFNGLEELAGLQEKYGVRTAVHLNPTYIAENCSLTTDMIKFGYQAPEMSSIIEIVVKANKLNLQVYVGLDDEGIAVEGGIFRNTGFDRKSTIEALLEFNKHQNLNILLEKTRYKPVKS